jgi:hypothetical protein
MVVAGHISDLARRTNVGRAALRGVASGSARVRAAGARLAEARRGTAGDEAPPMPPELVSRIDQALAAEVARRQHPRRRAVVPAPAPDHDVQIPGDAIPPPRTPVLGG